MLSALIAFTLNPFFAPVPQSELAEPISTSSQTLAPFATADEPTELAQADNPGLVV